MSRSLKKHNFISYNIHLFLKSLNEFQDLGSQDLKIKKILFFSSKNGFTYGKMQNIYYYLSILKKSFIPIGKSNAIKKTINFLILMNL